MLSEFVAAHQNVWLDSLSLWALISQGFFVLWVTYSVLHGHDSVALVDQSGLIEHIHCARVHDHDHKHDHKTVVLVSA